MHRRIRLQLPQKRFRYDKDFEQSYSELRHNPVTKCSLAALHVLAEGPYKLRLR